MGITIHDIANRTGYTIATVSRALNASDLVRPSTAEHIRSVAKEMGYIGSGRSKNFKRKKNSIIGIIFSDIMNPFCHALLAGMQSKANGLGYDVVFCNSSNVLGNEIRNIKILREHNVSGIIIDPLCDETHNNIKNDLHETPVLYVSIKPKGEDISYIITDVSLGAKKATKYLMGLGHKNIAFIGVDELKHGHSTRKNAYIDTMRRRFNNINNSLIVNSKTLDRTGGYNAINSLILEGIIPSAVIAFNDILALGVMECCRDHGFKIPTDISIIGFDDIEYASLPGINLTTVASPRAYIGEMAVTKLIETIEAKSKASFQLIVEPQLIIRKTCSKYYETRR